MPVISAHAVATEVYRYAIEHFAQRAGLDNAPLASHFLNIPNQQQAEVKRIIQQASALAQGKGEDIFEQDAFVQPKPDYSLLRPLFSDISLKKHNKNPKQREQYYYTLDRLSPQNLFPIDANKTSKKSWSQVDYHQLWGKFIAEFKDKNSGLFLHQGQSELWLDHLDTLWNGYACSMPYQAEKASISLYDHTRITAAIAVTLWQYEQAEDKTNTGEFLLIQGDFFGIQHFIFDSGSETNKRAAKLLRGRSLYVSLLSECAGLRVLEALQLPPSSQIINVAGKFQILAPNTQGTIEALQSVKKELNQWFRKYTWGLSGVGLVWQSAYKKDFKTDTLSEKTPFEKLLKALYQQLEHAKYQRLNLCEDHEHNAVFDGYLNRFVKHDVCAIDGRSPGEHPLPNDNDGEPKYIGKLARDQIAIGDHLVKARYIAIGSRSFFAKNSRHTHSLSLLIFGYRVTFSEYAGSIETKHLKRLWHFRVPDDPNKPLWDGYARRYLAAYVPTLEQDSEEEDRGKYDAVKDKVESGDIKTLSHLACDNRLWKASGGWKGITALMTLKGDIDNLGLIFQRGMKKGNFSSMISLSRQINAFFSIYLPCLCQTEDEKGDKPFRNSYTVFAGGDDFFLLGPWYSQLLLAQRLRSKFQEYVAQNKEIHFSVGLHMTKAGVPINRLAYHGEEALDEAKAYNPDKEESLPKNAVNCFGQCVSWDDFEHLLGAAAYLDETKKSLDLSTGYIYGLLTLVDMAEETSKPENAIWHSWFAYRTYRMLEQSKGLDAVQRKYRYQELAREIANRGIEEHQGKYRIALFTHLYRHRN